ncbi:MAG: diphthamide synthesis protein [archaeon]
MKIVFIESKQTLKVKLPKSFLKMLPKKTGVFTTVQYINKIDDVIKQMLKAGITAKKYKLSHSKYEGQILGCNIEKFTGVDGFLYIGEGKFHPKAIALRNELPVYTYNPLDKKSDLISKEEISVMQRKEKGALLKFYSSTNIGVLITLKHGQSNLAQAQQLQGKFPDKKIYFFADDTFDFSTLENFPFIDCFVNTACKRIGMDDSIRLIKPIINADSIL